MFESSLFHSVMTYRKKVLKNQFYKEIHWKYLGACGSFSFVQVNYEYMIVA